MTTVETTDAVSEAGGHAAAAALVPTLLAIAKSSRAFLTLLLAEIDLHPGQDQLLHALLPGETISVSVLAEQLAVRPSTVSKMLDRLIERDLVRRASSDQDARRTLVTLTDKGAKAKAAVQTVWERLETDLKAALKDGEFESSMHVLLRIDTLLATKLRRLR